MADTTLFEEHQTKVKKISRDRVSLLRDGATDSYLQAFLMERCKRDIVFFANYFVMGEDPRLENALFPMVLFTKQESFFHWICELETIAKSNRKKTSIGACVKSRDTGASVMAAIYLAHRFIWGKNFSGAIGSRKAELVYSDGNPDALFSKIEAVLKSLPKWMIPNYSIKRNLLSNLDNGNNIKGEAGANIGRGGRSTVYMIDEAAFLEQSSKVIAAVSKNTDCLILFSTPNGRNNQFAKMYHNDGVSKYMIHWSDDPRRDQEWYENQCSLFESHIIAQELDCDFDADRAGVLISRSYYNAALDAFSKLKHEVEKSYGTPIIAGFDPAGEGRDRSFLIIRRGSSVIFMDSWNNLDTLESSLRVMGICKAFRVQKLIIDAGYGATILSILKKEKAKLTFSVVPINFGGKTSNYYWKSEERTSKDKFLNARAEMFWMLRERFRKTYESVTGIRRWDYSEMIDVRSPEVDVKEFIPQGKDWFKTVRYNRENLSILASQITVITWEFNEVGKIKMISKKQLEKSPDALDALALCFYDVGKAKKGNWSKY